VALARLLWRIDADTGGFEAGARRMEQSTERVSAGVRQIGTQFGVVTAALVGAIQLADQLADRIHELDLDSLRTSRGGEVLGEGRASALAVESYRALTEVGPTQFFDAAEAVADALSRDLEAVAAAREAEEMTPLERRIAFLREQRTGQPAPQATAPETPRLDAAAAIGLDAEAFVAEDLSAFERSNLLLDALLAAEGEPRDVLRAASELGAGDIRDFVELAGAVRETGVHPRQVAERIESAGAFLSDEQAAANARAALERSMLQTVGREVLAGEGPLSPRVLAGVLSPFDDRLERAAGAEALAGREQFGWGNFVRAVLSQGPAGVAPAFADLVGPALPQQVDVQVTDSTVGGITAVQRVSDGQADGRSAGDVPPPPR